jgi:hypothetical protein
MFKSIAEIKAKCERIKKGQIIPRRIMKANKRRYQHIIKADCNMYALHTKTCYLVFSENQDGHYDNVFRVDNSRLPNLDLTITCSPYSKEQRTYFQGNHGSTEGEFLERFNKLFIELNAG